MFLSFYKTVLVIVAVQVVQNMQFQTAKLASTLPHPYYMMNKEPHHVLKTVLIAAENMILSV